jgi:hypothetical protein
MFNGLISEGIDAIRTAFRDGGERSSRAMLMIAAAVVLTACGPEAPPCNDAEVTETVLGMVSDANDAHLQGYPAKSADLATFALETPTVTSYDDKLKLRSCKTTIVMTIKPDKLAQMNELILNPMPNLIGALVAMSGQTSQLYPAEVRGEVAYIRSRNNNGPVPQTPMRKSLVYQIVKQEGRNEFVTTTNVSVDGTVQYLRVAAVAQQRTEAQAEAKKAQLARQAEIDQLSASGNWRKSVYIMDYGTGHNDPSYCFKNNLYCIHGRDEKGDDVAYYELDQKIVDQRGRDSMSEALRARKPVCLVGVQKTQNPNVFRARGYSTVRNDKGEAVDCLPGAEKENWAALVAQTKKEESAAASGSGAPATAAQPLASAPSTGPESLMSLVTKYEPCGEEAVCLHTVKGNVVWMQAGQMRRMDYALLDKAISSKTPVCLRDVTRTDAKNFAADGLDSAC